MKSVSKVTATVHVPGQGCLRLAPGTEVDLDQPIAEGVALRDAVNEDWFEEKSEEQQAPSAVVNEE